MSNMVENFNASDFREGMQEEYQFLFKSNMTVQSAFHILNEDGDHVQGGQVIESLKHALADTLHSVIMEHMLHAHSVIDFDLVYSDCFLGNPGGFSDGQTYWVEAESMCNYKINGVVYTITSGRIQMNSEIFQSDDLLNALLDQIRKSIDQQVRKLV